MKARFKDIPGYIVLGGIAMIALGGFGVQRAFFKTDTNRALPDKQIVSASCANLDPEYAVALRKDLVDRASAGEAKAQYDLANLCATGYSHRCTPSLNIKQDFSEAYFWAGLASLQSGSLNPMKVHLTSEQIQAAEKRIADLQPVTGEQKKK